MLAGQQLLLVLDNCEHVIGAAAELCAGLLEECRLVTVTGPGGSGKTRLAGQVARQVAGRFADGAWLVELAPVRDLSLIHISEPTRRS